MTEELLDRFSPYIKSLSLIPSSGGRFEVKVGDKLIYSKEETGRHANPGEVAGLFTDTTGLEPLEEE